MKRLIYIIVAVLFATSCATTIQITDANREVNNFIYNNGSVTWQNVYSFNKDDYDSVREWFNRSFNITRERENSIIGESNENVLPYQEAGYDKMSTIILFTYPCVVYFSTDFKEDRYRVTVNRIIWHPNVGIMSYGITTGVQTMDLNEVALKNGGYSSVFYNTSSAQLNELLDILFTPRLNETNTNDNW